MMRTLYKSLILIALLAITTTGHTQNKSLIGHHEAWGTVNPALNKAGDYSTFIFIHRNQWEGFGPQSNTLFYSHSFRHSRNKFAPLAVGGFIQYEDLNIINRTSLTAMISNKVLAVGEHQLNIGLGLGAQITSLKIGEFGLIELIDPELSKVDKNIVGLQQVGISFGNKIYEIGLSGNFQDFNSYASANTTVTFQVPLKNSKFGVKPILMYRTTSDWNGQVEAQTRVSYMNKVGITVGYRQNFGPIMQLGILINKRVKGSYGSELPMNNTTLGLTHEILFSYSYETKETQVHKADSVRKVKRDSIYRHRIDSLIAAGNNPQKDENELSLVADTTEKDSEPELAEADDNNETGVILFEDLPSSKYVTDNTHVKLSHVGFEVNSDILRPYAYEELDRLVTYLQHDHRHTIDVEGHTDNSGSTEYNIDLSKRRAMAVANYLLSRGIDEARIIVVGYGDTKPLVPNTSEANRALNRRIEITFHDRPSRD